MLGVLFDLGDVLVVLWVGCTVSLLCFLEVLISSFLISGLLGFSGFGLNFGFEGFVLLVSGQVSGAAFWAAGWCLDLEGGVYAIAVNCLNTGILVFCVYYVEWGCLVFEFDRIELGFAV